MARATMKAMLLSALAVVLLWRAVALGHAAVGFGLRATIDASRVELTLTLPILCVRVSAHFIGELLAISATPFCSRCQAPVTVRSWS